jgi:hypothetical protein
MNHSEEELAHQLRLAAQRGAPRGADEVLLRARVAHKRRRQMTRRSMVVGGGAAAVTIGAVAVFKQRGARPLSETFATQPTLATTTTNDSTSTEAPASSSSTSTTVQSVQLPTQVTVDGDQLTAVHFAFDRMWIAARNGESDAITNTSLTVFDARNGKQVGQLNLVGDVGLIAHTDTKVWIKATTGGPAVYPGPFERGPYDNALFEIDPTTLVSTFRFGLNGDGPIATDATSVVATDSSGIVVLNERGTVTFRRDWRDEPTLSDVVIQFPRGIHIGDNAVTVITTANLALRFDTANGQPTRVDTLDLPPGALVGVNFDDADAWLAVAVADGAFTTLARVDESGRVVDQRRLKGAFNLMTVVDGVAALQRQASADVFTYDFESDQLEQVSFSTELPSAFDADGLWLAIPNPPDNTATLTVSLRNVTAR